MSDYVTLWTVAYQAPLSMGFSVQEYWSGLPCPLHEKKGDLPDPGIEPTALMSPALTVYQFTTSTIGKPIKSPPPQKKCLSAFNFGNLQQKYLACFFQDTFANHLPYSNIPLLAGEFFI